MTSVVALHILCEHDLDKQQGGQQGKKTPLR